MHLQYNQLTGSIPAWLGALPLLSLDLSNNGLSGPIPRVCGTAVTVRLASNQLTGALQPLGGWSTQEIDGGWPNLPAVAGAAHSSPAPAGVAALVQAHGCNAHLPAPGCGSLQCQAVTLPQCPCPRSERQQPERHCHTPLG